MEVRQLAWLRKSGWARMRLLVRTVNVEGQAPTGKPDASPKDVSCGTSMTWCKPAEPAHLEDLVRRSMHMHVQCLLNLTKAINLHLPSHL